MKKVKISFLLWALCFFFFILWSKKECQQVANELEVKLEKVKADTDTTVTDNIDEHSQSLEAQLRNELERYEKKVLSMLCSMPDCPADCDVCCEQPYNMRKGKFAVHHLFTDRDPGLWNQDDRFVNLPLNTESTVVYVGANIWGVDGKQFLDMFNCTIHIFEPVPSFFEQLNAHWRGYKEQLGYRASLYNFGLGQNNRTVRLAAEDLGIDGGQGTFGMVDNQNKQNIPLKIKEGATILKSIMKEGETGKEVTIDLLHANCEGCEWEMFESLIENNLFPKIRSIQFGSHFYEQVPNLLSRYCNIREELKKTHRMVYGQSFAWERWDLK